MQVRWLLAVTPILPTQQKGAKTYFLRPRKGGAVMLLTFVSTWDIGDILSAVQIIITLVALFRADRKK